MINSSQRKPLVSVVIPLFNKEKEVLRAINSALSQTINDFEIIVVNDGSTDKGSDIVGAIKDPRIKIIDQINSGVSAARNRGIQESRAELITFLDADDEWKNDFLETIMYLKNKFASCEVYATNYVFRRKNNIIKNTVIKGLREGFKEGLLSEYFKIAFQSDPPIWSSAVAVSNEAIKSVGGFPVGVTSGEDLLAWAKLAAEYDIAYTKEPKAYFYESEVLSDYPRIPQVPDIVGQQLSRLLEDKNNSRLDGLREYIALWYRMRANVFIRLHQSKEARKEIFKALFYTRTSLRLYLMALLTLVPSNMAIKVMKFLKLLRESKRRQSTLSDAKKE
jgi:glycosyltransferase involved in cell wall biosynthesis